jgi:hypothetical protein
MIVCLFSVMAPLDFKSSSHQQYALVIVCHKQKAIIKY